MSIQKANSYKIASLILLAVLLSGCAKSTPTENIIDNNIDHYNQVIDYANNNMEDTPDTRYLKSELKHCVLTLQDIKETHKSDMDSCEKDVEYWKLATFGLFVLLCLGIIAKIKRII